MFMTFEGIDGAGKSTLVGFLGHAMMWKGDLWVHKTFEPGSTQVGADIRKLIMYNPKISPQTQYLLFAADRAENLSEIRRHIERGRIVCCDRYIGSSLTYQVANGLKEDDILAVFYAMGGFMPDLTFWLDLDAETAQTRVIQAKTEGRDNNHFDVRPLQYYRDLQARYANLAHRYDWIRLDASQPTRKVANQAIDAILNSKYTEFAEKISFLKEQL